ncbi:hypothetical protein HBI56_027740 [Parastagonospora nodorum]|uniref:Uncharacterized protein n=1 Tax=Phaeosphaeria nodorum (strain SN15 / ATCC MYA-4574 / FGSC 10173) TaxID=321614 RepID=A0A7U2EXQ5_PHANO|nr:hypothetical protein HBH56_015400 [Parastagonospora nodorum]QRC95018.1 hypothetical protein JI435_406740 [Parastagonospora nodorum SN15]KAH3936975.1 hypothetical protein HBH54_019040 [Parastagonospora nodorum]KAH3969375.1 hypothetical protein HBH51_123610 [Parastagonospora nodorum]KAH3990375.1 hypothetical protein HBH52_008450 [Parastagonospora nodorum]
MSSVLEAGRMLADLDTSWSALTRRALLSAWEEQATFITNHSQPLRAASRYFLLSSELIATVNRVPTQKLYPRREECMVDVAQFSSVSLIRSSDWPKVNPQIFPKS